MRKVASLLALGAMLATTACQRKADAPGAASGHDWAKEIVGRWVPSDKPLSGTDVGQCNSDTVDRFDADGTYRLGDGSGRWSVSGNDLTTVVSSSTGDHGASSPVRPELVTHYTLIDHQGRVITARIVREKTIYWYPCPSGG